jgi:hypothetical protein
MSTVTAIEKEIADVEEALRVNEARRVSTREYFGAMADCDAQHGLFKQGNRANRIKLEAQLAELQGELRVSTKQLVDARERIHTLETALGTCSFRECMRCHEWRIELESLYPRYRRLCGDKAQPRPLTKAKRKLLKDRHHVWMVEYGRDRYCLTTNSEESRFFGMGKAERLSVARKIVERYERLADRHGVELTWRLAHIRNPDDDFNCGIAHQHLGSGEACYDCGTIFYTAVIG